MKGSLLAYCIIVPTEEFTSCFKQYYVISGNTSVTNSKTFIHLTSVILSLNQWLCAKMYKTPALCLKVWKYMTLKRLLKLEHFTVDEILKYPFNHANTILKTSSSDNSHDQMDTLLGEKIINFGNYYSNTTVFLENTTYICSFREVLLSKARLFFT